MNSDQIICLSISGSKSKVVTEQPQVENYTFAFYLMETQVNFHFVIFFHILYLSHTYFFSSNIFHFTHLYFFVKRGENVVYDISGTWYRIYAHKVTQPYVRLVHSSIYSFSVIPLSRAALIIILDITYVASAASVISFSKILRYARLPRILVCYLRLYNKYLG